MAKAEVLVSSDDNYLQAKGGVAKAILDKAGIDTLRELNYYRKSEPKLGHGDVVVTTGGGTGARAIIHPAVIDLVQDRYPNQDLIRKVVSRCLDCAVAFGARSIAFPVLGGGTASKHLKPWDSIQAIVSELMTFAEKYDVHADGELSNIALYVFDTKTIAGDLDSLFTKPESPALN
jgi:O-acetyl-ADP-ribose deacetylase (regulator of RNase III)